MRHPGCADAPLAVPDNITHGCQRPRRVHGRHEGSGSHAKLGQACCHPSRCPTRGRPDDTRGRSSADHTWPLRAQDGVRLQRGAAETRRSDRTGRAELTLQDPQRVRFPETAHPQRGNAGRRLPGAGGGVGSSGGDGCEVSSAEDGNVLKLESGDHCKILEYSNDGECCM